MKTSEKLALLPPQLAELNVNSWRHVVGSYENFISKPHWYWLLPLVNLVTQISQNEYAKLFRAGRAIYHTLISTKEKHGLETAEPFVGLYIEKDQPMWFEYRVGYKRMHYAQVRDDEDALLMLEPFLERLWNETRGKKECSSAANDANL